MKKLNEYIVDESKTRTVDITNYGNSWIGEWGPDFCGNVLTWFITGVQQGMKNHPANDAKFQKRCEECIEHLLDTVNKEIY